MTRSKFNFKLWLENSPKHFWFHHFCFKLIYRKKPQDILKYSKVEIVVINLKRMSCWHWHLSKHKLDKPSSLNLASYPGSHKEPTWHWKNTRLTTTRTRKSDSNNALNLARKHNTNLLPVRSLQHSFYVQIVCHLKLIQNSIMRSYTRVTPNFKEALKPRAPDIKTCTAISRKQIFQNINL